MELRDHFALLRETPPNKALWLKVLPFKPLCIIAWNTITLKYLDLELFGISMGNFPVYLSGRLEKFQNITLGIPGCNFIHVNQKLDETRTEWSLSPDTSHCVSTHPPFSSKIDSKLLACKPILQNIWKLDKFDVKIWNIVSTSTYHSATKLSAKFQHAKPFPRKKIMILFILWMFVALINQLFCLSEIVCKNLQSQG